MKKTLILLLLSSLLSSCNINKKENIPVISKIESKTYEKAANLSKTSPYEMLDKLKNNDIYNRYKVLKKIITDNNFEKYFEGLSEYESDDTLISTPVLYEYQLNEKEIVLMLLKINNHNYNYLLFVKENDIWNMDCAVSIDERDKPSFCLEYTQDKEDFWLVYREEVSHGTGESIFNEVWVDRYGNEKLRYISDYYEIWETAQNTFINVNIHTNRSHSLQDITFDEIADYFEEPPYTIELTCYVDFGIGEFYGDESFGRYDRINYIWNKEKNVFEFDLNEISEAVSYMNFSLEDINNKDVLGENFFDFSSKYRKIFEESKIKMLKNDFDKETMHKEIINEFKSSLPKPY